MKKIHTYLQLGLWLIIAMAIPHLGFAQTCDVTPMNISKIATDWTTNCARVTKDACDPTNGKLCDGTPSSNWLLLNPNDYCLPKAPCNAVGFSKVEVTMTMEGTWKVKNIGNLSQNTSVGLLGCVKAWMCNLLFDPLEPAAFTGTITLEAGEEKSGDLPTRTKTSPYPGDLDALFAKNCSDKVCIEGLADGFTTLTISNGNLQAVTTVFASLKACVNYKKFDWSVTGSEAACETSSDGKVFVNFTPATGTNVSDYEIRVGNGGTWAVAQTAVSGANTISGLPSGSYTVAVVYKPLANTVKPSDSESCGYCKSSVTVASATATISCASTPDCPGGAGDGTVSVSVTGSNLGTVKYLWGNGANTSAITGLTPGNYSVTVTYGPNDKCSKIQTCTVVAAPGVDADVTFTNVKCKDAADGTITVDPTNGTANYTISVTGKSNQTSNGATKTFTGFGPGMYTVTVTDKNGCVYTEVVEIKEPDAITGSITPTPAACTGATNGSATVSASGGTGSYTYNWSRGTVAMGGTQVTGLEPGSISVTVTDANNCKKILTSTIGTVSEVSINCTPTPEQCVGQNNGSVSVAVLNASPNYVASWISGPTQFNQVSSATSPVVVNNLKPGNYTIRITDNNGCYAECSFTVDKGLDLPCDITGSTSICQGETQNAHSVESVAGATYAWSLEGNTAGATFAGATNNSTVTVSIPSNATGSYTVRMTISKNGCTESCTKTVTIKELVICTINGPASVCEGSTATFTTTGVTGRTWSVTGALFFTGQGTNSITVTIPDGTVLTNFTVSLSGTATNNCPTNCSTTTTINQKPEVDIEPISPVCNLGTPQGAIQATATGTAPFVYRLYKHNPSRTLASTSASTANTSYNFTNLGPGTYDVEVTDANNCTSNPSTTLILVKPVAFEPELDCESRSGENIDIILNITNGTGPFTYSLNNNSFSVVPANGIISVPFADGSNQPIYLKDANDCPAISETILLQCCKLEGVCKLTKPSPLTGCDYSVVPAAKTNPADVFSNIAFCEEAKIKVITTDGGSLCGDGLTRTYTYILYDDLNDNDKFDEDDEPFIEGTCAETYVVKPPALSCTVPTDFAIQETCTTQNIANLFSTWKNSFTYTGGCSPMVRYLVSINDGVEAEYQSIANISAPTYCGGKVKIKILVKDACTAEKMCMSTFIVPTRPDLEAEGPKDATKPTCASTTDFASWKAAFKYTSGGCNYKIKYEVSINGGNLTTVTDLSKVVAPSSCGGSVRIVMTVTDDCDQIVVKDATYRVPTRPTLVAAGPENVTKETCASTSDFATWKAAFQYTSGGCNYKIKYEVSINGDNLTTFTDLSKVVAPSSCGGSVRIVMTVTDDCGQTVVKDATYTVPTRPTLVAAGPESVTKEACASTNDFASWKAAFKYTSGGCNYKIKYEVSINGGNLTTVTDLTKLVAPSSCGGSVRIVMTVTDDCDQTVVKDETYTVLTRPDLVINLPVDKTVRCLLQAGIDTEFAAWIAQFNTSGGCSATVKYYVNDQEVANLNNVKAPSECGGKVTIKIVMTDVCDQTLTKSAYFKVIPKPVGLPIEKTIYSCIAVNVDLQLQVKCDVQSTFKWYSVASVGSNVPYNHPQIDGETFNPAGTSGVINDLLTNLTTTTQTIIYRVVPTSKEDCEGDPFYVTVNIRPKADIQCLACVTEVRVTLDKNCRLLITPDLVIDGFEQCPNRELLRDALEVLIEDGNNDNYVDCAGTHKYLVRLKPEYEVCFDYAPCWGTIIADDKTGPILECANFIEEPLDCYDVNYVLNNRLTIGNVGTTSSPRPSTSNSQVINNAEGIEDDSACGLKPASLVSDNIKNLGYPYFRDNCRDCGCRTTLKWSDRVEYYSCEQMEKNGGIYARIFRQWVATDCNGMTTDKVQMIDFKRPKIAEFSFNGGGEGKYDRVVEYNACTPDKSLIKKEDVTPSICSYFNTGDNKRCLYIDEVECNYSVQIKDTEFPICGGKGLKIDREMYIFDWCAGGIVDTLHILIKIGDFEAPTYDYAHGAPFDISTGPMDCTAAIPVTATGIKAAFGVTIKDNCTLGNVSVSVYTKDRYVKGILVYEGPDYPFCQPEPEAHKAELRGEHEDLRYCNKEDICWDKVEYAVMNGMMIGLPVGKHLMVIDAFDGCYNASTACFVFEVKDKIAPVMKCDDDLHITLSNANGYTNGYAQVSAADIDEGSWDNCKMAWIAVRRNVPASCAASFIAKGYDTNGNGTLDPLPADKDYSKADGFDRNGDGDIEDFGETFILKGGKLMTPLQDIVEFFCCDLSERVTIELWGADTADNPATAADETNYNYCWDDVLIEDKVAPTC
ncbi:MAG: PKD-like domain-containing protein, partial [Haliscomenobacter sp.]|uniref:PKD-like domain-containing protein n=1 Tax=Haliscomenobacter sp. TaxID=2717303 RepID=UPI0029A0D0C4